MLKINSFRLAGFRGYPQEERFDLLLGDRPGHLVVFGRNARGKSAISDAFEFFFSADGSLARFKQRETQTTPGRRALVNDKAEAAGRALEVEIILWSEEGPVDGSSIRPVEPDRMSVALPEMAEAVVAELRAPFIVRGWELRKFVEDWRAQDNYQRVASWFGLEQLAETLETLRAERLKLERTAEDTTDIDAAKHDISSITGDPTIIGDENTLVAWFNEHVLGPLQADFIFERLSTDDPSYEQLTQSKIEEEHRLGITQLRGLVEAVSNVLGVPEREDEDGSTIEAVQGTLEQLEAAAGAAKFASDNAANLRDEFAEAYLAEALGEAKKALENPEGQEMAACFVCGTEFEKSAEGSRQNVVLRIETRLTELERITAADLIKRQTAEAFTRAAETARTSIKVLISSLKAAEKEAEAESLAQFQDHLTEIEITTEIVATPEMLTTMAEWLEGYISEIATIEGQQGDATFKNALEIFDKLDNAIKRLVIVFALQREMKALSREFTRVASSVATGVAQYTQTVLEDLRDEMVLLYRAVMGGNAPDLKLVIPDEEGRRSDKVFLQLDFSPTRRGVIPQGYLSDAQLHTVALCYRVVAARKFNTGFPVLVLDDVMTSYDAGYKRSLVRMLVENCGDMQMIILTHDDGFYRYLQSPGIGFASGEATFRWIERYDRDLGPIFAGYTTQDEEIETLLDRDDPAVNQIRKAIESWLNQICRDFGARTLLPSMDNPGDYNKADLAIGLGSAIKRIEGKNEVNNRTLQGLVDGTIENLGSHFQVDGTRDISAGDARGAWEQFKAFRDLFVCSSPGCGSRNFKTERRQRAKPKCVQCDTEFEFVAGEQAESG